MTKRLLAAISVMILVMLQTGCASGGSVDVPDDSLITDSVYEADFGEDAASEESEPRQPADTESEAASEETLKLPGQAEDSDEGKVYNIFCSDEKFMELVARCCEDYEEITEEEPVVESEQGDSTREESVSPEVAASAEEAESREESTADENTTYVDARIGDAKIRFIICREEGERYLTNLDLSLIEEADINNLTDLYIVDSEDVQKYVDPTVHAAMSLVNDVGVSVWDLRSQYAYTVKMGSGDDGEQRALSYAVSPGVFMYDRRAAREVLGSDDPADVQEMLADWDLFDAVAARAGECGYAMLEDWNDPFDAFASNISGDWLTETGGVKIDGALLAWTEQAELYKEKGYYAHAGGRPVFGTFISADELIELVRGTDTQAADFEPKYGICPGPDGWYRGGSYLVVNSLCDQRSLTKKILEQVVFDAEVLRQMKADGILPNNTAVLPEDPDAPVRSVPLDVSLGEGQSPDPEGSGSENAETEESGAGAGTADGGSDVPDSTDEEIVAAADSNEDNAEPADRSLNEKTFGEDAARTDAEPDGKMAESLRIFLGGQDPYPVFAEAAGNVELGEVSVFGNYLCEVYEREFASYFSGEKDRDTAMKIFYTEVSQLVSEEE